MITKKIVFLLLLIAMPMGFCKANIRWEKTDNGIEIKIDNTTKHIQFYDKGIVRVTTTQDIKNYKEKESLVVTLKEHCPFKMKETKNSLKLSTNDVTLLVNKEDGNIEYKDRHGNSVLKELKNSVRNPDGEYSNGQLFGISATEALYGLGQYQNGNLNHRNKEVLLVQSNRTAVVPFLVSTANYGVLWDNYSKTLFKDDKDGFSFESKVGNGVDYYFMVGDNMDKVISNYRKLSGKAPMFAKSAYGYWQSKERYRSFDDLLFVAREYRERALPIDNIVQDWQYWGNNDYWSGMFFNEERFAHPKENIKKLHDMNIKLMCSIWPAVGLKTKLHKDLDAIGAIFHNEDHWTGGEIYDVYNPQARDIYADAVMNGLVDLGVDALWLDGTEVEVDNSWSRQATESRMIALGNHHLGNFEEYLNSYSLMAVANLYDAYKEKTGKRPFILTRSAFAGQQRYGSVTWSGDIGSSWDIMKNQIAAGVNLSVAGIPYWSHDIGGFFTNANGGDYPDGVNDYAYRELYVRWFQFGIFTPIFRSHGTGTPREIYQFGESGTPFYDALEAGLKLRYRLMPYIYSQAWNIYKNDYTLMRPLAMDFKDEKVHSINDAYMFGGEFLVKPVTNEMFYSKETFGEVIAPEFLSTQSGKKGLEVTYYNDVELKNKVFEDIHPNVDFNWGGINPENLSSNHYSMRWQGELTPPKSGTYRIGAVGDDGFRLWIDGKLIAESWKEQKATYKFADIELAENKTVDIKIEYFQAIGGAEIKLTWLTPDMLAGNNDKLKQVSSNCNQTSYLPKDCGWYDYWTNDYYTGGTSVTKEYPIDIFPLFVKQGSIIPTIEGLQYATDKVNEPIKINIYAGADGSFVLYDDKGDGYDYLNGAFSAVRFDWNDKSKKLTIKRSKDGTWNKEMIFEIVLINKQENAERKQVIFKGKKTSCQF